MLRSLVTFHANGRTISDGELVDPKDPIVKGREALFEKAESAPVVEQATAEPGARRSVRRAKAADDG